ncbi:MAG: hypothetical protein H7315_08775 [Herminiimonas sp.]|nr:hypothetical protein [Herminiimonas sp.]
MAAPTGWQREARNVLRAELARRGVSYKALSRALESIGVEESAKVLSNKIGRGTFGFDFFLQCMRVLDIDVVRLKDPR